AARRAWHACGVEFADRANFASRATAENSEGSDKRERPRGSLVLTVPIRSNGRLSPTALARRAVRVRAVMLTSVLTGNSATTRLPSSGRFLPVLPDRSSESGLFSHSMFQERTMRYGRILELIRRSSGALLLLGSVGALSDSLTLADDANCATTTPASQPQCSDDVYKKAGERLAQQLEKMGSQPCGSDKCAASGGNGGTAGCDSGCKEKSCLFGNLFDHGNGCAEDKKEPWSLTEIYTDKCGKNHFAEGWKI